MLWVARKCQLQRRHPCSSSVKRIHARARLKNLPLVVVLPGAFACTTLRSSISQRCAQRRGGACARTFCSVPPQRRHQYQSHPKSGGSHATIVHYVVVVLPLPQNRMQRCAMDCAADAKDLIPAGAKEGDAVVERAMAQNIKCTSGCAKKHLALLPNIEAKIKAVAEMVAKSS
ncbi:unnamed protein product [Ectocarpus sp. 6 AP-2014]